MVTIWSPDLNMVTSGHKLGHHDHQMVTFLVIENFSLTYMVTKAFGHHSIYPIYIIYGINHYEKI